MLKRFGKRTIVLVHIIWVSLFGKAQIHGRVTARGDKAFVRATMGALELLKARTPDVYSLLEKHIESVISGEPSGVFVRGLARYPATMVLVGPAYAKASVTEYAGALAHEAYHCELYRRAEQSAPGRPVPRHAYSGQDAESQCLKYQCDVLRRLGLDECLIGRYESGLQSKWWEVPYDQRSW